MVHHHRYHQWRKLENHHPQNEEEDVLSLLCATYKRKRPKLVFLLLSLLSFCLILSPHLFCSSSAFSLFYSFVVENDALDIKAPLCSDVSNGSMCCDRTSIRADICVMKGDVRTHSASSSIFLYRNSTEIQHEKIKPYTRKWETSVMDTIDQLNLITIQQKSPINHKCDVKHDVPAVFFSTGGYTGNVYHEFNDGILPLYITSQQFNKKVVFVILEYHNWWMMKYGDVISHLSDFPPIDFTQDKRIHCFPEAIVGLRIHDELTIDPSNNNNKTIVDFHSLLNKAYSPRIKGLVMHKKQEEHKRPKLVILSRNASRAITNEDLLVKMAEEIGFTVKVLRPDRTTELAKIYRELNSSEVMIGVHGAAMTHFLFMKPGSVFVQVIPLGTEWAAETYYGEPARKLGLKYIGYEIKAKESSLYEKYDRDDPILKDPQSISSKGWEYTKSIYLDSQNVKLDLRRFRKRLIRAYEYSIRHNSHHVTNSIDVD
ncbi:xylan glycosyltransferase MUCI21-like [Euphorbia lathyris]|uniref:xylan glycosyltransferase MUCI21-like n=1 Tax=Euphorbia lathyris TaxID=212925 RepID=UPI00331360E3